MHKGSCLCGAVTFEVEGELPPADACHCTQCRKSSGHYFVSTNVKRAALTLRGGENVTWYPSSAKARRGFCSKCGSSLFWDPIGDNWTSIALGAVDNPTGSRISEHIYVADKGDYYEITDGVPQFETVPPRPGSA